MTALHSFNTTVSTKCKLLSIFYEFNMPPYSCYICYCVISSLQLLSMWQLEVNETYDRFMTYMHHQRYISYSPWQLLLTSCQNELIACLVGYAKWYNIQLPSAVTSDVLKTQQKLLVLWNRSLAWEGVSHAMTFHLDIYLQDYLCVTLPNIYVAQMQPM